MRKAKSYHLPNRYILLFLILLGSAMNAQTNDGTYYVKRTADFEITGKGNSESWQKADWLTLSPRGESSDLQTRAKALYSDRGIYFLFDNRDRKITASIQKDFEDLWNEDVVEVFLWTDEDFPIYFEYELSPLNHELVLLVPNLKGQFLGWQPWHYQGERLTQHKTWIDSTNAKSEKSIHWRAEFFIPYELLHPLGNVPPKSGTSWRGNLYRCDYDLGHFESWAWQPVEKRFHEYKKFGTLIFE
jgi:Carbohydrate-binding family 9